jgi:hypothetical protein
MAWEYGTHGRYGRPWQIDHADSTIPLGVSPPSLAFFIHSPALSSFWRTNPVSLKMLPCQTCFHCTACSCPADLKLSLPLPNVCLSPSLDLGSAPILFTRIFLSL